MNKGNFKERKYYDSSNIAYFAQQLTELRFSTSLIPYLSPFHGATLLLVTEVHKTASHSSEPLAAPESTATLLSGMTGPANAQAACIHMCAALHSFNSWP
jgi:hypothetical protein